MPLINLNPIDSEGIRLDRPAHEVRWRKLTNVVFRDGSLVNRPGFEEFGDDSPVDMSSLPVEPAPVIGIMEVHNPGSSITGRESWAYSTEIIRPDGSSDVVAGWTGDHTALDETPPGGDVISTSTAGAQKALTFANASGTYDVVAGYLIRIRARNTIQGGFSTIKLYSRSGGVNYAIPDGTLNVYAYEAAETADWNEFAIPVHINPVDGAHLVSGDITALSLVVEFVSGSAGLAEIVVPAGNGNYTQFDDATDGGSATYTDYDLTPFEDYDNNGAKSDTADEKQSWTLPASFDGTFNTVTLVTLQVWLGASLGEHEVTWFYRTGSTDYDIDTESFYPTGPVVLDTHGLASASITLTSSTNPATAAAWTQAELDGGEFGLKNDTGKVIILKSVGMIVEGTTTGQGVQVDTVSVEPMGMNITAGSGFAYDRLISSNQSHLRADGAVGPFIFTDVTNSVAMSASPSFVPTDHAILYGQVYEVNGNNPTRRYPNGSNVFEALSANNADDATPLTGRTVAAFADRILYGWLKDNATITPERVAYSQEFNGGTHSDTSAGDFDIIDTPGGIVKILALNESIAFCGKEVGIYALRRTGNSSFPIIVDPIDYETRCVAMASVKRVVTAEGRVLILFLGWNPSLGFSVFSFDGTSVTPVGAPIAPALRDDANHEFLRWAFAGIDPDSGTYWLMFAEGDDLRVDSGYAMYVRSGAWTRIELPFPIFSMGNWTVPTLKAEDAGTVKLVDGKPTLVLGGQNNIPYITHLFNYDSLKPPEEQPGEEDFGGVQTGSAGKVKKFYTAEMETGDIRLAAPVGEVQIVPYRLHVEYTNFGPFRVLVKASEDGGINYSTANEYMLGALPADGSRYHAILDLGPHNAHLVRFNLTIVPAGDNTDELPTRWQIDSISIQHEFGGTDGP